MRNPSIALTLLTAGLIGCTDEPPTALSAGDGPAANVTVLPFQGTVDAASHTSEYDPATNEYRIHLVGTGHATHLGRYTVVNEIVIDPATLAGTEHVTWTAANGDVLITEGTTQGWPSGDGVTLNATSHETITGGTGRFAGATGSFIVEQVNLAPDRSSYGWFEGTISFGH